jgi:hypothetical protein
MVLGNTKHYSSDPTAGLPPICPADKPKQCRRISNVFINDRGFPDKSDHYDNLLCECLTAGCKAFSLANVKGIGTNDWVIKSLDD